MTASALWLKHRPMAHAIAADFRVPGADADDVRQEALIGLWVASLEWRPDGGASFTTFANLIVRRRLSTMLRAALAAKHTVLSSAQRTVDLDGDPVAIVDALPCLHQVVDLVEDRERLAAVVAAIRDDLTEFERHCVVGVANGRAPVELGEYKRVDNALWRARRKLRAAA